MKYNFTFSLALILCFSITLLAQEKEYTITASVKKYSDPYVAYLYFQGQNGQVKDSVEVKDGSFTFRGTVDEPRLATIMLRETGKKHSHYDFFSFYIEPGNLSVFTKSTLKNAEITGSSMMKDMLELDRLLASAYFGQPVKVVQETRTVTVPVGTGVQSGMGTSIGTRQPTSTGTSARRVITDVSELPFEVQSHLSNLQKEGKEKTLKFIKTHPDSFVSLNVLNSLFASNVITYTEYLPLFNSFSPALLNSNQGKSMAARW